MARLRLLGLENVQNAGAGQLGGIAAQGQVQGHPGQVAPLGIAVDGLGGVRQRPVQGGTEVVIQRLVVLARLLAGRQQRTDVPHGQHLFRAHTAVR